MGKVVVVNMNARWSEFLSIFSISLGKNRTDDHDSFLQVYPVNAIEGIVCDLGDIHKFVAPFPIYLGDDGIENIRG